MAGVLCAGALVGAACGRDAAMGAKTVAGPSALATEGVTAQTAGLTPAELIERGWSCRLTPAGTTACSPPGRDLPAFGAPADRPPSHLLHVFDTPTGDLLGFARMIRTDLYQGQICPSTGAAYTHLALIGYYECFDPVS
jgi:hypothetical protein